MADVSEWFGFRLTFLEESDQDAVRMVLQSGLKGYTVRLELKDGTVRDAQLVDANANFDEAEFERTGGNGAAASFMRFADLDENYNLTGATFLVRYADIAEIGIY